RPRLGRTGRLLRQQDRRGCDADRRGGEPSEPVLRHGVLLFLKILFNMLPGSFGIGEFSRTRSFTAPPRSILRVMKRSAISPAATVLFMLAGILSASVEGSA